MAYLLRRLPTHPIRNKAGDCIGAIGFGQNLEKKFVNKTIIEKIISDMDNTVKSTDTVIQYTNDIWQGI